MIGLLRGAEVRIVKVHPDGGWLTIAVSIDWRKEYFYELLCYKLRIADLGSRKKGY